jgi:hypothetical protein
MLCMAKDITLRRVGLVSLGFTVPVEFTRSLGLRAGDVLSWSAEGNTATLSFFKVTTHRTPALREKESVQEPVQEEATEEHENAGV